MTFFSGEKVVPVRASLHHHLLISPCFPVLVWTPCSHPALGPTSTLWVSFPSYLIATNNNNIAVIFILSSKSIICFFNFALFYSQVCSLLFVFRFIIAPLSFYCSFFCVCFVCFSVCLSYKLPFDCVHACLCGHLTMIWGLRVCWADALPTRVFGSPSWTNEEREKNKDGKKQERDYGEGERGRGETRCSEIKIIMIKHFTLYSHKLYTNQLFIFDGPAGCFQYFQFRCIFITK